MSHLDHQTRAATEPAIDGPRWFALRVRARWEKATAQCLHHKGVVEFLPLYNARRRWSDRVKDVELPLFPGYVFCRLDPRVRLPVLTTPGVLYFVGVGKVPAPVDDAEITAIQKIVESGLKAEPWPLLEVGCRVRIGHGPLREIEGILLGLRNRRRLVVSITLLQRSVAVEIERSWVERTAPVRVPCSSDSIRWAENLKTG